MDSVYSCAKAVGIRVSGGKCEGRKGGGGVR